jgi:hypothetical protein
VSWHLNCNKSTSAMLFFALSRDFASSSVIRNEKHYLTVNEAMRVEQLGVLRSNDSQRLKVDNLRL